MLEDNSLILVEVKKSFSAITYQDNEKKTKEDLLNYGKQYVEKELQFYQQRFKEATTFSQKKYWLRAYKNQYRFEDLEVMTFKEYIYRHDKFYTDKPIREVTEEEYNEQLNILPPLKWVTINEVEEFCCMEMYSGTITSQYCRYKGKYYTKYVCIYDKSTWLHNYIKGDRIERND